MADLLRKGAVWLEQMRHTHCSSQVEYRRDGDGHQVQATFGRTTYEVSDESGLNVGAHVWDFLILAEVLTALLPGDPAPADVIVADCRRYEVMALGDDTRGWRWSDPYRTTFRIHTRDIGPDEC